MKSKAFALALVLTTTFLNVLPVSAAEKNFADTHTMEFVGGIDEVPPLSMGITMKDEDGQPCQTPGFTPLMITNSTYPFSYSNFHLEGCNLAPSQTHENYQTITINYSTYQNIFIDCNWEFAKAFESFSWTYKPLNLMDMETGMNLPFIKDMDIAATLSRPTGPVTIYYKETYEPNASHTFYKIQDTELYDGGIYLYWASTGFHIELDVPNDFDVSSLAFYVSKQGATEYMAPSPESAQLTNESFTPFTTNEMDTRDYYFIKMYDVFQ